MTQNNTTPRNDKHVINFLLHHAAIRMLSASPMKSDIKRESERLYGKMRASYSKEDIAGVDLVGKIMTSLATQLARCQSVEALEQTVTFIEGLEKGEVMMAEQVGDMFLPDGTNINAKQ